MADHDMTDERTAHVTSDDDRGTEIFAALATKLLQEFATRLERLEDELNAVPEVQHRRKAARDAETRVRLDLVCEIADADQRAAELRRLAHRDLVKLVQDVAGDRIFKIVLDAPPDLAHQMFALIVVPQIRARIEMEQMLRDGTLPRHVRIQARHGLDGISRWERGSNRCPISEELADQLREAGVNRVLPTSSRGWEFAPYSISPSEVISLRVEALDLVKLADPAFGAAIDAGKLEVVPNSLDDDKAIASQDLATGVIGYGEGRGTVPRVLNGI